MQIRQAAMQPVVELDHNEKWAAAVKYPSRTDLLIFLLPGSQCFFYAAASKKNRKGRRSASTPHNWHGPAVVIGTEWDQGQQKESYWIRYNGRCRLVPPQNIRHASLEESLSREAVIQEIKASLNSMAKESGVFSYDDDREGLEAPPPPEQVPIDEEKDAESLQQDDPPQTPVGEQPAASIEEALKRFYAGQTKFAFFFW